MLNYNKWKLVNNNQVLKLVNNNQVLKLINNNQVLKLINKAITINHKIINRINMIKNNNKWAKNLKNNNKWTKNLGDKSIKIINNLLST